MCFSADAAWSRISPSWPWKQDQAPKMYEVLPLQWVINLQFKLRDLILPCEPQLCSPAAPGYPNYASNPLVTLLGRPNWSIDLAWSWRMLDLGRSGKDSMRWRWEIISGYVCVVWKDIVYDCLQFIPVLHELSGPGSNPEAPTRSVRF